MNHLSRFTNTASERGPSSSLAGGVNHQQLVTGQEDPVDTEQKDKRDHGQEQRKLDGCLSDLAGFAGLVFSCSGSTETHVG
jgi:hypothetical protein